MALRKAYFNLIAGVSRRGASTDFVSANQGKWPMQIPMAESKEKNINNLNPEEGEARGVINNVHKNDKGLY